MADATANPARKCLWVTSDHFASRLVFERGSYGVWLVVRAGPSLANLIGLQPKRVQIFLESQGWKYAWGDPVNDDGASNHNHQ
ncbi:MAG: hypothetical protein IT581_06465 [Verrucomicrobiales bacterium]|nr:hypothetical protein [Verrucomicrobiales bacterium]